MAEEDFDSVIELRSRLRAEREDLLQERKSLDVKVRKNQEIIEGLNTALHAAGVDEGEKPLTLADKIRSYNAQAQALKGTDTCLRVAEILKPKGRPQHTNQLWAEFTSLGFTCHGDRPRGSFTAYLNNNDLGKNPILKKLKDGYWGLVEWADEKAPSTAQTVEGANA